MDPNTSGQDNPLSNAGGSSSGNDPADSVGGFGSGSNTNAMNLRAIGDDRPMFDGKNLEGTPFEDFVVSTNRHESGEAMNRFLTNLADYDAGKIDIEPDSLIAGRVNGRDVIGFQFSNGDKGWMLRSGGEGAQLVGSAYTQDQWYPSPGIESGDLDTSTPRQILGLERDSPGVKSSWFIKSDGETAKINKYGSSRFQAWARELEGGLGEQIMNNPTAHGVVDAHTAPNQSLASTGSQSSTQSVDEYIDATRNRIAEIDNISEFGSTVDAIDSIQADINSDAIRSWDGMDEIDRLKADFHTATGLNYDDLHNEYFNANRNLQEATETGRISLNGSDADRTLQGILENATGGPDIGNRADFIDTSDWKGTTTYSLDLSGDGPTMRIPLEHVADAEGFTDWETGRGVSLDGHPLLKDGELSSNVISRYSQMPAETAPPIRYFTVYELPDGRTYINSHNAHRVGAAIARGDADIAISPRASVSVVKLDYIPDNVPGGSQYKPASSSVVDTDANPLASNTTANDTDRPGSTVPDSFDDDDTVVPRKNSTPEVDVDGFGTGSGGNSALYDSGGSNTDTTPRDGFDDDVTTQRRPNSVADGLADDLLRGSADNPYGISQNAELDTNGFGTGNSGNIATNSDGGFGSGSSTITQTDRAPRTAVDDIIDINERVASTGFIDTQSTISGIEADIELGRISSEEGFARIDQTKAEFNERYADLFGGDPDADHYTQLDTDYRTGSSGFTPDPYDTSGGRVQVNPNDPDVRRSVGLPVAEPSSSSPGPNPASSATSADAPSPSNGGSGSTVRPADDFDDFIGHPYDNNWRAERGLDPLPADVAQSSSPRPGSASGPPAIAPRPDAPSPAISPRPSATPSVQPPPPTGPPAPTEADLRKQSDAVLGRVSDATGRPIPRGAANTFADRFNRLRVRGAGPLAIASAAAAILDIGGEYTADQMDRLEGIVREEVPYIGDELGSVINFQEQNLRAASGVASAAIDATDAVIGAAISDTDATGKALDEYADTVDNSIVSTTLDVQGKGLQGAAVAGEYLANGAPSDAIAIASANVSSLWDGTKAALDGDWSGVLDAQYNNPGVRVGGFNVPINDLAITNDVIKPAAGIASDVASAAADKAGDFIDNPVGQTVGLASSAVGVAQDAATLPQDAFNAATGFANSDELSSVIENSAIGDVASNAYDTAGEYAATAADKVGDAADSAKGAVGDIASSATGAIDSVGGFFGFGGNDSPTVADAAKTAVQQQLNEQQAWANRFDNIQAGQQNQNIEDKKASAGGGITNTNHNYTVEQELAIQQGQRQAWENKFGIENVTASSFDSALQEATSHDVIQQAVDHHNQVATGNASSAAEASLNDAIQSTAAQYPFATPSGAQGASGGPTQEYADITGAAAGVGLAASNAGSTGTQKAVTGSGGTINIRHEIDDKSSTQPTPSLGPNTAGSQSGPAPKLGTVQIGNQSSSSNQAAQSATSKSTKSGSGTMRPSQSRPKTSTTTQSNTSSNQPAKSAINSASKKPVQSKPKPAATNQAAQLAKPTKTTTKKASSSSAGSSGSSGSSRSTASSPSAAPQPKPQPKPAAPAPDPNQAKIDSLYKEILGRSADKSGGAFWKGQLEKHGEAYVRRHLEASPEAVNKNPKASALASSGAAKAASVGTKSNNLPSKTPVAKAAYTPPSKSSSSSLVGGASASALAASAPKPSTSASSYNVGGAGTLRML